MRLKAPEGKPPMKRFLIVWFSAPPRKGKPLPKHGVLGEPVSFPRELYNPSYADSMEAADIIKRSPRGVLRVYRIGDDGKMHALPEKKNDNAPLYVLRASQARGTVGMKTAGIDNWGDRTDYPEREFWPVLDVEQSFLKKAMWG